MLIVLHRLVVGLGSFVKIFFFKGHSTRPFSYIRLYASTLLSNPLPPKKVSTCVSGHLGAGEQILQEEINKKVWFSHEGNRVMLTVLCLHIYLNEFDQ